MATTGTGGGVRLQSDGLESCRRLLVVALLVVTSTMFVIDDVHCITIDAAPLPPIQNFTSFPHFEEDALEDIMKKWIKLNQAQLVTRSNWCTNRRTCDNRPNAWFWASDLVSVEGALTGALTGVVSTLELQLQVSNATANYYEVSVTSWELHGSNSSCTATCDYNECGFDGIIGKLPLESSSLTKLQTLIHFKLKSLFTWMAERITILCLALRRGVLNKV